MPNRRTMLASDRRRAEDPPRKTGWQVRSSVAEAVRQAVREGAAESQNAFVERALVRELRVLRRRRVYDAYAAAARDAAFTSEQEGIRRDFEPATGDGFEERE
jgi:hypothetical protein